MSKEEVTSQYTWADESPEPDELQVGDECTRENVREQVAADSDALECRADAEAFIAALAGSAEAKVTFQTFVDAKGGGGQGNIFHGTLAEHWDKLVALNRSGHGVFLLINQGDLRGRKKENVIGLRALFIDDDGKNAPVIFNGTGVAPFTSITPTITVQSKAGQHNYFQLIPREPLGEFTSAQHRLARHFGTDRAVKDLTRVMRVPGFFHMKDPASPFMVKLVQVQPNRYTIGEVLTAYPATIMNESAEPSDSDSGQQLGRSPGFEPARRYIAKVPPAIQGEGGDSRTFSLCATLARGFDLSDDECIELLLTWNQGCQPPWSEQELRIKVANGREYGTEEVGGRLKQPVPLNDGDVLPTEFAALCDILRDSERRKRAIGRDGELEMDVRTAAVTLGRRPYGDDVDLNVIRENVTRYFRPTGWDKKFEFTKDKVQDALQLVAAEKKFHPVQEYLNGLKWDGEGRLTQVPTKVLGLPAEDLWGPLNMVLVRRWFISAVARAMQPGCKVDTVLILVGKQGNRKSSFFSVLGGEWFTDSFIDMENKDGMLLLGKTWIIELGELDSMVRARNQTAVKAFIASQKDMYRPPYGRVTVEVPRSSVFVGTTNEDLFLTDPTGNRRYWPISGCDQPIALDVLRDWRDQLWAEAVELFRQGEQWHLTDQEESLLTEKLKDHERLDPWHSIIADYVASRKQVRTEDVLTEAVGLGRERQGKVEEMRVTSTLKKLGFRSGRAGAKRERMWTRD